MVHVPGHIVLPQPCKGSVLGAAATCSAGWAHSVAQEVEIHVKDA